MNVLLKHSVFLVSIYIVLALLAVWLTEKFGIGPDFVQTAVLLTGGLVISFVVMVIFYSGFSKGETKRVQRTLIAVGLKFLLYAILVAICALVFKNLSTPFIVTFFIIYLAFTTYLLFNFTRVLKSKKL